MDQAQRVALSALADAPQGKSLRLLFIHHSCGGQLLAPAGPDAGSQCIYDSHPNGGGLRSHLEQDGYEVHEASYGSAIGARTDHFDWLPKFRDQMEAVLACEHQDSSYSDGQHNHIVVFKSCFPNNQFVAEGTAPGNPAGPELTVWNGKAAYQALLKEFRRKPEVLFVCLTPPPLAFKSAGASGWRRFARRVLGHGLAPEVSAAFARQFNRWLCSPEGWLKEGPPNVAAFDLFDLLTNEGASDWSCYANEGGGDSHPNRQGNGKAAAAFVPFLNRAVQRAGLVNCLAHV